MLRITPPDEGKESFLPVFTYLITSKAAEFTFVSLVRLQELTVCPEDNVDVHDIELMQYINVDCSKLKRLLQGTF